MSLLNISMAGNLPSVPRLVSNGTGVELELGLDESDSSIFETGIGAFRERMVNSKLEGLVVKHVD